MEKLKGKVEDPEKMKREDDLFKQYESLMDQALDLEDQVTNSTF